AQAQDQERRQEALQAHGHRQGEARRRRQASPADQPQRQVYPPEPRHRSSCRRRHGASEALGALRPQL
ncbi:MAG: LSU ribosomal protein L35p, partial [uncultured Sphingomonas sp.]